MGISDYRKKRLLQTIKFTNIHTDDKEDFMIEYLIAGFLVFTGAVIAFMKYPPLGKVPDGSRQERIRRSVNYKNGSFHNLSPTPNFAEGVTVWKVMTSFFFRSKKNQMPDKPLPSIKTDLKNIDDEKPVIIWFGHSSYFLQINSFKILVDPVFCGYASPFPFVAKNFAGSNDYDVDDFPELDLLIITHDHYDHLDYQTLKRLRPKVKHIIASLGVGAHLERWGYPSTMITELDWHEQTWISQHSTIVCTPARHFSGRTFKRNQTLWSSFVLKVANYSIYIGGDSGYDTHFKEIGNQYGPFDLAILECGQYNEFWKYIHMMPEETAQAAIDLQAKALMPVHWGKFSLAMHAWNDPILRVMAAGKAKNISLVTLKLGEKIILGTERHTDAWWQ